MPESAIAAFPWESIARTTRRREALLSSARRGVERSVDPAQLAAGLSELTGAAVELVVRDVSARLPPREWWRLGFAPATPGSRVGVAVEAPLVAALLSALLRRPVPMVPGELSPEPALLGALSALVVEVARGSGSSEALRPASPPDEREVAVVHATVIVAGRPYAAAAWFAAAPAPAETPRRAGALAALGQLELELPLVVGAATTTARALASLGPGDAFVPASGGLWVSRRGVGRGVLVPGSAELGYGAELLADSGIVVGEPTRVSLAPPEQTVKSNADRGSAAELEQAVLEAPLVVRIELASVSLSAREWAALKPGDVIETRRRVGGPVVLRSGGRALAHGELVSVEGELGVRVTRLLPEEPA